MLKYDVTLEEVELVQPAGPAWSRQRGKLMLCQTGRDN